MPQTYPVPPSYRERSKDRVEKIHPVRTSLAPAVDPAAGVSSPSLQTGTQTQAQAGGFLRALRFATGNAAEAARILVLQGRLMGFDYGGMAAYLISPSWSEGRED